MFQFFRESLIVYHNDGAISFNGDHYEGKKKSFYDINDYKTSNSNKLYNPSIESSYLRNFLEKNIGSLDFVKKMGKIFVDKIRNEDNQNFNKYLTHDTFFIESTCPSYLLSTMFEIAPYFFFNHPRNIKQFGSFNHDVLMDGFYLRQDINDFSINNNKMSSHNIEEMKKNFISHLPKNIRKYLIEHVDLIFSPNNNYTFADFFERLAIFTVFNKFSVYSFPIIEGIIEEDTYPPKFREFIFGNNVKEKLDKEFHQGEYTVHEKTGQIAHAIFNVQKQLNYVDNIKKYDWEVFIIKDMNNLIEELSFNKIINNTKHKTKEITIRNSHTINTLENKTYNEIEEMINNWVLGNNEEPSAELKTMSRVVFNIAEQFFDFKQNWGHSFTHYIKRILEEQNWTFSLKEEIYNQENLAYRTITQEYKKKLSGNTLYNKNNDVYLVEQVYIVNLLLYIAQELNINNNINTNDKKYTHYVELINKIYNSELTKITKTRKSELCSILAKTYLQYWETMQIELILDICSIKQVDN